MQQTVDTLLEEIKEDRTTGARELVRKGADTVAQFIASFNGEPSFFLNELIRISKILIDAQPSNAPFFHLTNIFLLAAEGHKDIEKMRQATKEAIEKFIFQLESNVEQVSQVATGLIPEGSKILTHSFSSTVLRTLVDAKRKGKEFEVICTESRPICEGLQLAEKLSESGVKVQLQIDSAAPYTMKGVDLVLVGADCITLLGLVNKVGTYSLSLSAKEQGVPFYVLCGTEKLLGAGMARGYRIVRRDPKEVWLHPPAGVNVFNFYFDTTPLDLLTAIVTEEGMIRGTEIFRRFHKTKVSKYFPM